LWVTIKNCKIIPYCQYTPSATKDIWFINILPLGAYSYCFFFIVPLIRHSQSGQGGGNAGQGGGPGGGNGNDPCARANPPPSCSNVPIDDDIWILMIGSSLIGGFFVLRAKKLEAKDNPR